MLTTLVVTASTDSSADQFRAQLQVRDRLGLLGDVDAWRVIPDPPGQRVGSGGSTIRVLRTLADGHAVDEYLAGRRLLIVHAGGLSRRMPAYAVCGKLFCPVPADPSSALPMTLFDLLLDRYLNLPCRTGGQVIVCSGDVLLRFDPSQVDLSRPGLTGIAALETADEACDHGVFADVSAEGRVRRFWQKPEPGDLERIGALDGQGRTPIDLGIMSFTPELARRFCDLASELVQMGATAGQHAVLDFYTELACALGSDNRLERYLSTAHTHGAGDYDDGALRRIWDAVHGEPFHCSMVDECEFLHFGTSEDFLHSSERLEYARTRSATRQRGPIVISSGGDLELPVDNGVLVEGCDGTGQLRASGENLIIGPRINGNVHLRAGVCLDIVPGRDDEERDVFFYRLYGIRDTFKGSVSEGTCTFLNEPVERWMEYHGVDPEKIWPGIPASKRSLWNARMFPAAPRRDQAELVLWMQEDEVPGQKIEKWLQQRRWSMKEMSQRADGEGFWEQRYRLRTEEIREGLEYVLTQTNQLSAADMAWLLEREDDALGENIRAVAQDQADPFSQARLFHSLGTAISSVEPKSSVNGGTPEDLWRRAYGVLREGMVATATDTGEVPGRGIKDDEIVWARSPVRLDLAGGWTDTPPYTLERGGAVVNAAVDLNGQPPVQVFARLSNRPSIRLVSIDLGIDERVMDLESLGDYRSPAGEFSIAKAALALAGFSPEHGSWPPNAGLSEMLEEFGAGIELTTLCAVPKGSGLGTSSVLGATVIAAIARLQGVELSRRELFHRVLLLEQMLTTGGGWQDQVGGAVGGLKLIRTEPGMVPDPEMRWLNADVFCPTVNGGSTLLYYTGITRLAKDILHNVVGRYLDREREALEVLKRLRQSCAPVRDALERRDVNKLGNGISEVWELNKRLDPGSTNERVEDLFDRVAPYACGAKLLGAGGGGFMLIVCPTPRQAERCREDLMANPPNDLARFFDFHVSHRGLEVTVS